MIVSLIVASPLDLEAIVSSEDRPAFVDAYRVRAVRMVGGKTFGGKTPYLLHMIQPAGNALAKARAMFDRHGIDILAMQRYKREGGEVVVQRKVNKQELKDYLEKVWDYDEDGQPIPGTERYPSQVPHKWAGYADWV